MAQEPIFWYNDGMPFYCIYRSGSRETSRFIFREKPGEHAETGRVCLSLDQLNDEVKQNVVNRLVSVPEVTAARVEQAIKDLEAASSAIKVKLGTNSELLGHYHLDRINVFDYLPQMVKEGRLDRNHKGGGYFQISTLVAVDMRRVFGLRLDSNNPVDNCIAGILYNHYLRYGLVEGGDEFKNMDSANKDRFALAAYNMGFGTVNKLVKELKATDYVDFEIKLSDRLAGKKDARNNKGQVFDPYYQVHYTRVPLIDEYLTNLDAGKKIDTKDRIKIGEAEMYRAKPAITLRYVRTITALRNVMECGPHRPPVEIERKEKFHYPDNTVWKIGRKVAYEVQSEVTFEDYFEAHDITDGDTIADFVEIIILFNKKYNPDLSGLDPSSMKNGVDVWIPSYDFFLKRLTKSDEAQDRAGLDIAPAPGRLPEKLPARGGPFYMDSSMNERGKEVLPSLGEPILRYPVYERPVNSLGHFNVHRELSRRTVSVGRGRHRRNITYVRFEGINVKRQGQNKPEYIILHSTASKDKSGTISRGVAHFVIDRDGKMFRVSADNCRVAHAGETIWNGDRDLNKNSIGIEVVAPQPQDGDARWTNEQYVSIKKLVHELSSKYHIPVRNILSHQQVAANYDSSIKQYRRGRKPDPFFIDWEKLGLPNNYRIIDPDVVAGRAHPNLERIDQERAEKSTLRKRRVNGKSIKWRENSPWWNKDSKTLEGLKAAERMRRG